MLYNTLVNTPTIEIQQTLAITLYPQNILLIFFKSAEYQIVKGVFSSIRELPYCIKIYEKLIQNKNLDNLFIAQLAWM
jgi:hypothetical protein